MAMNGLSSVIWTWIFGPVMNALTQIQATLQQMQAKENQMATTLQDLQAAEAAMQSSINAAITLIQQMQAGSVSDADVEAVVSKLQADAAALNAAVTPPAPTP
jgi:type II secretory pathway component PulM